MKLYHKKFPQCQYLSFNKNYTKIFQLHKNIQCYDPVDHYIANDFNCLAKRYKVNLEYINNPGWIEGSLDYPGGRVQTNFYKWQRKRLGLFTNRMNPLTYDTQNRKPFNDKVLPLVDDHVELEHHDYEYTAAVKYVNKNFAHNPGEASYWLPGDHKEAIKQLHNFFKYRLKYFGDYEDAINQDVMFGFHSVLSPLINIGLLTPDQIINEVVKVYKNYPFNNGSNCFCLHSFKVRNRSALYEAF
jgi:deoxyribodipyrimidine photolyase-related protein